jgi:hypothetical protein
MEKDEIEHYLEALGHELEQQFTKHHINGSLRVLIVGGVFMILVIGSRGATEDIDAWLLDQPTTTYDTAHLTPELKAFKAAVRATARRHHLKQQWMNDVVTDFIKDMAPDPSPQFWKRFGPLEIWFPDERYILALKVATFRDKDRDDVEALLTRLHITRRAEAQAIIDLFIPDKGWQAHYDIESTLDELFYQELLEDEDRYDILVPENRPE